MMTYKSRYAFTTPCDMTQIDSCMTFNMTFNLWFEMSHRPEVQVPHLNLELTEAEDEGENNLRRLKKALSRDHEKEALSQDALSRWLQKERLRSSQSVSKKCTGDPLSRFLLQILSNHTNQMNSSFTRWHSEGVQPVTPELIQLNVWLHNTLWHDSNQLWHMTQLHNTLWHDANQLWHMNWLLNTLWHDSNQLQHTNWDTPSQHLVTWLKLTPVWPSIWPSTSDLKCLTALRYRCLTSTLNWQKLRMKERITWGGLGRLSVGIMRRRLWVRTLWVTDFKRKGWGLLSPWVGSVQRICQVGSFYKF